MLVGDRGEPVWPIGSREDRSALDAITAICGGSLRSVNASEGWRSSHRGGIVLALGREAVSAAGLHAHLTRRRLMVANEPAELGDLDPPAVLVTLWDRLTPELLNGLYGGEGDAPGIIAAPSESELRSQVLVRSAAARLGGVTPPSLTGLFAVNDFSMLDEGGAILLGRAAPSSARRLAMTHGADLLALMTHSDGVDAYLGPDLTLCSRVGEDASTLIGPPPLCRLSGRCHRHRRTVAEAARDGVVLAPEDVAARVLLVDVCFGVMPQGSLVDPRYGLGTRLARSSRIGAMLAPWQIAMSGPDDALRIGRDILAGMALGEAVARFNAHPDSRERHHRLCLLGDPDLRWSCMARQSHAAEGIPVERNDAPTRRADPPEDLLPLMTARAVRNEAGTHLESLARRASDAAGALTRAGNAADDEGDLLRAVRGRVLDYALARGKLTECWLPLVDHFADGGPTTCPACGRTADRRICRVPGQEGSRRLVLCAICGVVEDAPEPSQLTMALDPDRASVRGLPCRGWAGGLALSASDPMLSVSLPWPAGPDGRPVHHLSLPRMVPLGPLRVSVVMLWGTSFAVLSRLARGVPFESAGPGEQAGVRLEPLAGKRLIDPVPHRP